MRARPPLRAARGSALGAFVPIAAIVVGAIALGVAPTARADDSASALSASEAFARFPQPRQTSLQYGVAFTIEGVAAPGPVCADTSAPCILGSGGGIAVRAGARVTEDWYFGGVYELSKQDPGKLYRLAILQQARAEVRRYFRTGRVVTPFALLGLGLAGYGNEWALDTWGPTASFGVGAEVELSAKARLGISLAYRPLYLHSFVDSSTLSHDAGVAHIIGIELALEAREGL
jgi:hypothetical protein